MCGQSLRALCAFSRRPLRLKATPPLLVFARPVGSDTNMISSQFLVDSNSPDGPDEWMDTYGLWLLFSRWLVAKDHYASVECPCFQKFQIDPFVHAFEERIAVT